MRRLKSFDIKWEMGVEGSINEYDAALIADDARKNADYRVFTLTDQHTGEEFVINLDDWPNNLNPKDEEKVDEARRRIATKEE